MTKYIFITGGVVSGIGKGIVSASIARLLKNRGFRVTIQKLDPYINVDPGTMGPLQHGEVFVTEDGSETDLDLGHYERFIDENLTGNSSVTAGKIYWSVIQNERNGHYLGKTVQVIPHITDEIKRRILEIGRERDIAIIEIGGTVGDIESRPFIEAIRQISLTLGRDNIMYIHNTLITTIPHSNELKTKPTQHSVRELLSFGIQPDVIVCRSPSPLGEDIKSKIALFCNLLNEYVIENLDVANLYDVPQMLDNQNICEKICKIINVKVRQPVDKISAEWDNVSKKIKAINTTITIALVGKYVALHDAYLSVEEALNHAGILIGTKIDIKWIDSERITEKNVNEILFNVRGILIPGGFGQRGIEGMVSAAKFARVNDIPFFGICLGLHIVAIEFSRNVLGLLNSNSMEFENEADDLVVSNLNAKKELNQTFSMKLGSYALVLEENSKAIVAYKVKKIVERYRHRYAVNLKYEKEFLKNGLIVSARSEVKDSIEIMEIPKLRWYVAVQFHPEFKSRPNRPHPLFVEFVRSTTK